MLSSTVLSHQAHTPHASSGRAGLHPSGPHVGSGIADHLQNRLGPAGDVGKCRCTVVAHVRSFVRSRSSGSSRACDPPARKTPRATCQLATCPLYRSRHFHCLSPGGAFAKIWQRLWKEGLQSPLASLAGSGMLGAMASDRATSEPRRRAVTTKPHNKPGTRPPIRRRRGTRRPGDPIFLTTSPKTRQTRTARVHWPSWRSHRAYVGARRLRNRQRRRSRRTWPGRHPLTAGTLVVVVLFTPLWASLGSALTSPALGLSVPRASPRGTRQRRGLGRENAAKNWWYSHHQPPVGGRPSVEALPTEQHARVSTAGLRRRTTTAHLPEPAPLTPFARPALAGEGSWRPTGRLVRGIPAVYETFLRPDAVHTSVVDGIAWLDTRLLSATLYSGSYIPGGGPYTYTAPIQPTARGRSRPRSTRQVPHARCQWRLLHRGARDPPLNALGQRRSSSTGTATRRWAPGGRT